MADGNAGYLRVAHPVDDARSTRRSFSRVRLLRWSLLLLGPLVVALGAVHAYLAGGRYVSTDDAYVRADKVTITTDVSGTVAAVEVANNQHVAAGQVLFRIDDEPYRIAVEGAQAQLGAIRNDIEAMRSTYRQKLADLGQAQADVAFFEREFQ